MATITRDAPLHAVGALSPRLGDSAFSVREARSIVRDLFRPSPTAYWTDFLCSMAVAYAAFAISQRAALLSPLHLASYVVAVLAIYRSALFIHELSHLPDKTFRSFRIAWNLLCGIPFLVPTFLYYTHAAHHARRHYGTHDDGEYLPLASSPPWAIVGYLAQSFVIPVLAIVRFLALTPLSWISPRLRRWVQQHASSMIIDPNYVRPLPMRKELRTWRLQEVACFLFLVGAIVLIARGRLPWTIVPQAYAIAVGVIMLNAIRTLGAHRYLHGDRELSFVEQLQDSLNYPRWPLVSELWAPVGLRFHALHHLFPSMPYHSLPEAHRRLMEQLPADSVYRRTESAGLVRQVAELWKASRASSGARPE